VLVPQFFVAHCWLSTPTRLGLAFRFRNSAGPLLFHLQVLQTSTASLHPSFSHPSLSFGPIPPSFYQSRGSFLSQLPCCIAPLYFNTANLAFEDTTFDGKGRRSYQPARLHVLDQVYTIQLPIEEKRARKELCENRIILLIPVLSISTPLFLLGSALDAPFLDPPPRYDTTGRRVSNSSFRYGNINQGCRVTEKP
jgi:hypothetical protein